MDAEVRGRVVRGLRAASGRSRVLGRGTVAMQMPHFRAALPDLDSFFDGRPHVGTLNVAVAGRRIRVAKPAYHLRDIAWERGMVEHFYLSPCVLRYSGRDYRGMLYIPDPETKPDGLPVGTVLEVLTTRVPFIRYGAAVKLRFDRVAVDLIPARTTRRPLPRRPKPKRSAAKPTA